MDEQNRAIPIDITLDLGLILCWNHFTDSFPIIHTLFDRKLANAHIILPSHVLVAYLTLHLARNLI